VVLFLVLQLFNGTFSRQMEAGGVELLIQKLEKFFYRVKRSSVSKHRSKPSHY